MTGHVAEIFQVVHTAYANSSLLDIRSSRCVDQIIKDYLEVDLHRELQAIFCQRGKKDSLSLSAHKGRSHFFLYYTCIHEVCQGFFMVTQIYCCN